MSKHILGIDPGRSKTGLALTDSEGTIIRLMIADSSRIESEAADFLQGAEPDDIVIGDGTNSGVIGGAVKKLLPGVPMHTVGEAHSTEEARSLYWEINPPGGWRRFVPLGMLVPGEPLDAYAAVVQIRRWLKTAGR